MTERSTGGRVAELARRPLNREVLHAAHCAADAVNALCGDAVRVYATYQGDRITRATFVGDACAVATASASLLTERLRGMRIDQALGIEPAELVDALGEPIPVGRHRCATLPLDALRRAFGASPVRPTTDRQVVAIVLAAGSARRFGGEKVTAPILGVPVVRRAVLALTGACDRVLVVAAPRNSEEVRRALADLPVEVIVNEDPERGMARSLRTGIDRATAAGGVGALLVALGDQPFLSPDAVAAVVSAWRVNGSSVVVPVYDGARGHPVLFDADVAGELLGLEGDVGARAVVDRDPSRVRLVPLHGPAPADVDTVHDFVAIEGAQERPRG